MARFWAWIETKSPGSSTRLSPLHRVEDFLDTPAKRYSSGMYLRLGFAIAAHLEPDILLLDEVLTVGDAAFQAKCLQKIKDASLEGTTVLFVSHNVYSVGQLCDRAFHIHSGQLQDDGPAGDGY
jgi:lipopolysaccharide transport system ATP-binding protein